MRKSFSRRITGTIGTSIALMASAVIPTIALVQPASAAVQLTVARTISLGSYSQPTVPYSDGSTVWVANDCPATYTAKVNAKSGAVLTDRWFDLQTQCSESMVSAGNYIYTLDQRGQLVATNKSTDAITRINLSGSSPSDLVTDGRHVWVMSAPQLNSGQWLNTIDNIDSQTNTIVSTFTTPAPYGHGLYMTMSGGNIYMVLLNYKLAKFLVTYNILSDSITNTLPLDTSASYWMGRSLVVNGNIYFTDAAYDDIHVVRLSDYALLPDIQFAANAGPRAITADNDYVYVAMFGTNSVKVYTKSTMAYVQDVAVGGPAHGMYSDGTNLWVTTDSHTLVQIGIKALAASNTVAPAVTDTTSANRWSVGDTVSTTNGTWSNATGYAYQWYRCSGTSVTDATTDSKCTAISSATSQTYTIATADRGYWLASVVTATGDDTTRTTKTSSIAGPVPGPATNSIAPVVTDITTANSYRGGDTVSTTNGTWTGSNGTYTYQWYRCTANTATSPSTDSSCASIGSATASTYVLAQADADKYLVAVVTTTGTNSVTNSAVSNFTNKVVVLGSAVNTVAPVLADQSGSGYDVGGTVMLREGTWTNFKMQPMNYTFTFYACTSNTVTNPETSSSCTARTSPSMYSQTYTIVSGDTGKYIVGVVSMQGMDLSYTNARSNFSIAVGSGPKPCTNRNGICSISVTYSDAFHGTISWTSGTLLPPASMTTYAVTAQNGFGSPASTICTTAAGATTTCSFDVDQRWGSNVTYTVNAKYGGSTVATGGLTTGAPHAAGVNSLVGSTGIGVVLVIDGQMGFGGASLEYSVNGKTCTFTYPTGNGFGLVTTSNACATLGYGSTQEWAEFAESGWLLPNHQYTLTGSYTQLITVSSQNESGVNTAPTSISVATPFVFSFTTLSKPKLGPTDIAAVDNQNGSFTVSWKDPAGPSPLFNQAVGMDSNGAVVAYCSNNSAGASHICTMTPYNPNNPNVPVTFMVMLQWDSSANQGTITEGIPGSYTLNGRTIQYGVIGMFSMSYMGTDGVGSTGAVSAAPGSPASVVATRGNGQITVTWVKPTGANAPTSYTVSVPGQTDCVIDLVQNPSASLSCTFSGLTNGTSYTATVVATNDSGSSSGVTASATPMTAPSAPTGVTASAGNGSATVSWTAPSSNGGSAVTSYTVTASPGGLTCTVNAPATTCTVSGLTNGTAYTFSVVATSTAGNSTPSSASTSVSPQATVPGAPTNVTAASGNGEATVSWTAPVSDGGESIDGYIVTSSPGGLTCTAVAPDTTCTITGLTNGTAYTFTVVASNNIGASDPSSPSNSVTPAAGPSAPDRAQVTPGNHSATINWNTPVDGVTPNRYVVAMNPGGRTCTVDLALNPSAALTCTFTGLTNGVNYSFTIAAFTANGMSANDTVYATPAAAPTKPSAPRGVKFRGSVAGVGTVTWKVSGSNGGSAITKYVVYVTGTRYAKSCTVNMAANPNAALTCSVRGLKPKRFYNFRVKAVNAYGQALSPKARQAIDTVIRVVSFAVGKTTMWSGLTRQAFITAGYIKKFKYTKVTLTGYTNPGGTLVGRTRFTQQRALTVANYFTRQLRAMGVKNVTVIAVGTGASIYKGPVLTPLQRKKNRSVATMLSYK